MKKKLLVTILSIVALVSVLGISTLSNTNNSVSVYAATAPYNNAGSSDGVRI